MNDDDIDFSGLFSNTLPADTNHTNHTNHKNENLLLNESEKFDLQEIKSTTDLESQSKFPLQIEADPQKVTEADLVPYDLRSLDKKVLINEMSDYDMYLKNIHKGFKSVTSVRSLIHLVQAGISIHKHRRQVLNDIKSETKKTTLEFDEHGNLK